MAAVNLHNVRLTPVLSYFHWNDNDAKWLLCMPDNTCQTHNHLLYASLCLPCQLPLSMSMYMYTSNPSSTLTLTCHISILYAIHLPGTLASSNISSHVLDPLIPSLSSFWAVENPSVPFSTIKAVTPWDGFLAFWSVLAYTWTDNQ